MCTSPTMSVRPRKVPRITEKEKHPDNIHALSSITVGLTCNKAVKGSKRKSVKMKTDHGGAKILYIGVSKDRNSVTKISTKNSCKKCTMVKPKKCTSCSFVDTVTQKNEKPNHQKQSSSKAKKLVNKSSTLKQKVLAAKTRKVNDINCALRKQKRNKNLLSQGVRKTLSNQVRTRRGVFDSKLRPLKRQKQEHNTAKKQTKECIPIKFKTKPKSDSSTVQKKTNNLALSNSITNHYQPRESNSEKKCVLAVSDVTDSKAYKTENTSTLRFGRKRRQVFLEGKRTRSSTNANKQSYVKSSNIGNDIAKQIVSRYLRVQLNPLNVKGTTLKLKSLKESSKLSQNILPDPSKGEVTANQSSRNKNQKHLEVMGRHRKDIINRNKNCKVKVKKLQFNTFKPKLTSENKINIKSKIDFRRKTRSLTESETPSKRRNNKKICDSSNTLTKMKEEVKIKSSPVVTKETLKSLDLKDPSFKSPTIKIESEWDSKDKVEKNVKETAKKITDNVKPQKVEGTIGKAASKTELPRDSYSGRFKKVRKPLSSNDPTSNHTSLLTLFNKRIAAPKKKLQSNVAEREHDVLEFNTASGNTVPRQSDERKLKKLQRLGEVPTIGTSMPRQSKERKLKKLQRLGEVSTIGNLMPRQSDERKLKKLQRLGEVPAIGNSMPRQSDEKKLKKLQHFEEVPTVVNNIPRQSDERKLKKLNRLGEVPYIERIMPRQSNERKLKKLQRLGLEAENFTKSQHITIESNEVNVKSKTDTNIQKNRSGKGRKMHKKLNTGISDCLITDFSENLVKEANKSKIPKTKIEYFAGPVHEINEYEESEYGSVNEHICEEVIPVSSSNSHPNKSFYKRQRKSSQSMGYETQTDHVVVTQIKTEPADDYHFDTSEIKLNSSFSETSWATALESFSQNTSAFPSSEENLLCQGLNERTPVNSYGRFDKENMGSIDPSILTNNFKSSVDQTPIRRSSRERKLSGWFKKILANKSAVNSPVVPARAQTSTQIPSMPLISQVVSLAPEQVQSSTLVGDTATKTASLVSTSGQANMQTKTVTKTVKETTTQTKVLVQPSQIKTMKNKSMLCKPVTQTKATSCRPHAQTKEVQTDDDLITKPVLVPVPVPIYIPVPMAMYSIPVPYPVPMPIPIPVPCFIPTTKKSAAGIMKQITKIQSSMPADPFEAELLAMAAAVAGEEKDSSSESEEENTEPFEPDNAPMSTYQSHLDTSHDMSTPEATPKRGRGKRRGGGGGRNTRSKKMKTEEEIPAPEPIQVIPQQPPPDENMVLKFTYGVNAWKHWVMQKNEQIQKTSTRSRGRLKPYKTDILACTPDELNFSLCQFVSEVRKPNGEEYAPDSIYYLCLGIQEYIYENGRVDNIFTDVYYDRFTECLNEVIKRYEVRLNAQGLIVCRIEEEHLWESKQLGAHSPFVLLNTLIYFNARYFMLRTPEEHLRLSFSHIMKHWKKTNMPGTRQPGRSVYLRYYAPVHQAEVSNKRRREELPVFEQGENVENPLRCPVKLYEFYLSKCPESIKNRNDVFYLMPERSCVPDSPVWYSTGSLPIDIMSRMLNRIRVIKEIQEAHLAYQPMGLV